MVALVVNLMLGLSILSCQEKTSAPISLSNSRVSTVEILIKQIPTLAIGKYTTAPICFMPNEGVPFAFSNTTSKLFLRTNFGVDIIDLQTGKHETNIPASQSVIAAAISPNGEILVWSLQDNSIQLIRLADQSVLATLIGHPDPVFDLRFSPLGEKFYSASHDGFVRVWELDGTQLASIETGSEVLGFGISSDGLKLATIPSDGPVSLWNLTTNQKIAEFGDTGGYDTSDAHFSPDDQYLAADLATGIYLWRISDGELLWNKVKNSMALAFSSDGEFLAYSDVDDGNKVLLTSLDSDQIDHTLGWLQGPVWEMFFSPDGSFLAATDGLSIPIWQVDSGEMRYIGKSECP